MSIFSSLFQKLEAPPVRMKITASERVGSHIQKVTLSFPQGLEFPVGSYIQPMIGGCVPRAYSIAECRPGACTIIVSFSGNGVGARFFAGAKVGTEMDAYGPFSDFPYHRGTGRPKTFLATGTGLAPFIRMIPEAISEELPSLLVLGVPEEYDIPYREYIEGAKKTNGSFNHWFVLSRPGPNWSGGRGYVTEQFGGERDEWLRQSDVYVCGVPAMTEGAVQMLKKIGVPKQQIYVQKFG